MMKGNCQPLSLVDMVQGHDLGQIGRTYLCCVQQPVDSMYALSLGNPVIGDQSMELVLLPWASLWSGSIVYSFEARVVQGP
jgi:hypothetical protein